MSAKNLGTGLLVLAMLCMLAALCLYLAGKRLAKHKEQTQKQAHRAITLGRRMIELALLGGLCLIFGGLFAYAGSRPDKKELVATALKASFPSDTVKVYEMGYTSDDWAQISFRGTVSIIATRGNGNGIKVGCMVEPGKFTDMRNPKLYALFTDFGRCPTNKEFTAAG